MARNKNILLIHDDTPARHAFERVLIESNFSVVSARTVHDALFQIQQQPIDIALLGLGSDAGKDWETAERLTQCQPWLRLIVAGAGPEGFTHPLASKVHALLEKPIDLPLLLQTLKDLPPASSPSAHTESVERGAGHQFR
jgi:DNA-binding NtrC family response regulator